MKFEDLSIKDKVLVAIGEMYLPNGVGTYDISQYLKVNFNVHLIKCQISNAIYGLRQNRYVTSLYGLKRAYVYVMTDFGESAYMALVSKLNAPASPTMEEIDEIVAKKVMDLESQLAAKDEEINNLKMALAKREAEFKTSSSAVAKNYEDRIRNIYNTLTSTCAKLDEKTKKLEKMEVNLDRLAASCMSMTGWINNIKQDIA